MDVPIVRGVIGESFYWTLDGVAVLRGRRVIAWNPSAERLFGVSEEEAVGDLFDLPAVLGVAPSRLEEAADGEPFEVPFGRRRTYGVRVRRLGDDLVVLVRDTSEHVRTVRGLRRLNGFAAWLHGSASDVDAVLQGISDEALAVADSALAGVVVLGEAGPTRMAASSLDGPVTFTLPPMTGALAHVVRAGVPLRVDDTRAVFETQGDYPQVGPLLVVPVSGRGGVVAQILVANLPGDDPFDATDEALLLELAQHATAALAWAMDAERARALEQRQREAIQAARHDIANPLAAGRGYVRLLRHRLDRMSDDQRDRALRALDEAFTRLEQYSHQLLLDERLQVSQELVAVPVDLDGLFERLVLDHVAAVGDDGPQLDAHRDPACPPAVSGDPSLVREVLDNLVSNAVKFSPPDGRVTVRAVADGELVRIDVSDEGPGIPVAEQAAVFERYNRSEKSRRDAVPGMGLGLSIVKRIVEAHGGTASLTSTPGAGTTMHVTFPAVVATMLPASAPWERAAGSA